MEVQLKAILFPWIINLFIIWETKIMHVLPSLIHNQHWSLNLSSNGRRYSWWLPWSRGGWGDGSLPRYNSVMAEKSLTNIFFMVLINHGCLCIYIDIHEYPLILCISIDFHGYPWISRILLITKWHAAWVERIWTRPIPMICSCASLLISSFPAFFDSIRMVCLVWA